MTKKSIVVLIVGMIVGAALFVGIVNVHDWHVEAKAYVKAVQEYQAQQQKAQQTPVSTTPTTPTK